MMNNKCIICGKEIKKRGIVLQRLCEGNNVDVCSQDCYDTWEAEYKRNNNEKSD